MINLSSIYKCLISMIAVVQIGLMLDKFTNWQVDSELNSNFYG
jgi:hypothetical protein